MSLTAAQVVALFETRYDYQSARTMLKTAAAAAGISGDGPFDGAQLKALASALEALNDRAEGVVSSLADAAAAAAPAKPASKPKPKAKAKAPAAKADAAKGGG